MTNKFSTSLSVIIMAFNERNSIVDTCTQVIKVVRSLTIPFEVLIVDDGSFDGTDKIAARLERKYPEIRCVRHEENGGLGKVYRTGFELSKHEWVTFIPADGQFEAKIVRDLFDARIGSDMVCGYLVNPRAGFFARALSQIEKILYRVLVGSMPKFQGLLLFRRDLLDRFRLVSRGRGWTVLLEFIIRVHTSGYKIKSVPTPVRRRLHGKSKVNNLRTIGSNLLGLARLAISIRVEKKRSKLMNHSGYVFKLLFGHSVK